MTGADPEYAAAAQALTDAVKSAILDRLIADLRSDVGPVPRSVYTKSDSGLYGKYEKADVPDEDMLRAVRGVLERLVREAEHDQQEPSPSESE